jgi:hypothetical protein
MAATTRKLLLGSITKDLVAKMLKDKGRELAGAIRSALPNEYGYMVILKTGGSTAFFTDGEKAEAIQTLREVLATLED